jgi:prepilin-type N-terminal cleavage/methylation domain-containing protein
MADTKSSERLHRRAGVSLTETLCVLAILTLLFSFYASAVVRAFIKSMATLQGLQ